MTQIDNRLSQAYAGIGSRKAPAEVLAKAERLAIYLGKRGWTLRSGAAPGMDTYFALGAESAADHGGCARLEEYLPYKGFNGSSSTLYDAPDLASKIASQIHPVWSSLSEDAKLKMTRNCLQILGKNLDDPVRFVMCWTPDGCESFHTRTPATGGTGQAIALASMLGIPVFNLNTQDWRDRFISFLDQKPWECPLGPTEVGHCNEVGSLYIGRKIANFAQSVFCNKIKVSAEVPRHEVLTQYVEYLDNHSEITYLAKFLKGKKLGCWCRQSHEIRPACHGDYLAAIADGKDLSKVYTNPQSSLF